MTRTISLYTRTLKLFRFHAAARIFAALVIAAAVMVTVAHPLGASSREKLSIRFLRAAHVMRNLYPDSHWPAVSIPLRIKRDDTTNALIKHQDASFVLGTVVRDLTEAEADGHYPQAGYYAAHALSRLGNHETAALTMKNYIAKAPFRETDYFFLVQELYAAADYPGLREAARAWQTLEGASASCSEDRLMYVWGSFYATGQHREAMEAVLSDPCAAWKGQIFFARSSLALGDEKGAEERLAAVFAAYPDKNREIRLLWNKLASAEKFP